MPSGKGTYSIWIAGGGRILLSLKTEEQTVTLVSVRSGEKEAYSWDDVAAAKDAVMHTVLSVGKGWKKTSGGNWEAEADGISEFRVNGTEEEKNRAGREQAGKEMQQTKAELRKPGKEALQGAAKPQKKESQGGRAVKREEKAAGQSGMDSLLFLLLLKTSAQLAVN